MDHKKRLEQLMNEPEVKTTEKETLSFPFAFADHSLESPAAYERLRQECPVARVQMPFGGDAFLLTRHADVARAGTDPHCGMIKEEDGDVPRREAKGLVGASKGSILAMSDARHNKIRRLVTAAFTVQHANNLRPRVVEVTNELIDNIERSGPPADLFEDYAIQTPMTVLCELLGIPREDEMLFREWGKGVISRTATSEEHQELWTKMVQYILPIIRKAQEQPGNDVISMLVKGRELGDEVLTEVEMYSFALGLIAAGFETVSTTFTNSAFILLQHPDLIEQLRERVDEPERMASAVEEILRVTPIGQGRPRIARGDVEFSGTTIKNGEVLHLSFISANFDEAVFPHAKEIDFDRSANPILTFGRGVHACIGQQIARMELQVLWTTLLKRLPTIRLAVPSAEVPWRKDDALTYGPANLPVTW
jgi:cytochrome P450